MKINDLMFAVSYRTIMTLEEGEHGFRNTSDGTYLWNCVNFNSHTPNQHIVAQYAERLRYDLKPYASESVIVQKQRIYDITRERFSGYPDVLAVVQKIENNFSARNISTQEILSVLRIFDAYTIGEMQRIGDTVFTNNMLGGHGHWRLFFANAAPEALALKEALRKSYSTDAKQAFNQLLDIIFSGTRICSREDWIQQQLKKLKQ